MHWLHSKSLFPQCALHLSRVTRSLLAPARSHVFSHGRVASLPPAAKGDSRARLNLPPIAVGTVPSAAAVLTHSSPSLEMESLFARRDRGGDKCTVRLALLPALLPMRSSPVRSKKQRGKWRILKGHSADVTAVCLQPLWIACGILLQREGCRCEWEGRSRRCVCGSSVSPDSSQT